MLLFSIHINSLVLTRRLPNLSCGTGYDLSYLLVNFTTFMIILPLFDYLTHYNILIFTFSVINVIQKNYTNPKFIQNLVLYSFGKSRAS